MPVSEVSNGGPLVLVQLRSLALSSASSAPMAELPPYEEGPSLTPNPAPSPSPSASSSTALSPTPLAQFHSSAPPSIVTRSPSSPSTASLSHSPPPNLHLLPSSSSSSSLLSLSSPTSSAQSSHPLLSHPLHLSQPSTYHTFPPPSPILTFEPASPLSINPTPSAGLTATTDGGSALGSEPSASMSSVMWEDPQLAEWGGVVAEVAVDEEGDKERADYARPQGTEEGEEEPVEAAGSEEQLGSHRALGAAYEVAEREAAAASVDGKRPPWSWSKFWKFTGPGWLMSIAYLDPGR